MPSKEEVRRIVEGFAQSGMTRRQYCEKVAAEARREPLTHTVIGRDIVMSVHRLLTLLNSWS